MLAWLGKQSTRALQQMFLGASVGLPETPHKAGNVGRKLLGIPAVVVGNVNRVRLARARSKVDDITVAIGEGNNIEAEELCCIDQRRLVKWLEGADVVNLVVVEAAGANESAVSVELAQRSGCRTLKVSLVESPIGRRNAILVGMALYCDLFRPVAAAPRRLSQAVDSDKDKGRREDNPRAINDNDDDGGHPITERDFKRRTTTQVTAEGGAACAERWWGRVCGRGAQAVTPGAVRSASG